MLGNSQGHPAHVIKTARPFEKQESNDRESQG